MKLKLKEEGGVIWAIDHYTNVASVVNGSLQCSQFMEIKK